LEGTTVSIGVGRPLARAGRRVRDEDGITLVELMAAILVLGIILSAFASVLLTSIRAVAKNEREVRASSIAQQVVEELQAREWDNAALYPGEIAGDDHSSDAWRDRAAMGDSPPTFDGHALVLLDDPDTPEGRLEQVPYPETTVEQANVTYTIHRYITWVDRSEDGAEDTKRFTVVVSWRDVGGNELELTTTAERVPTGFEAEATITGVRVLQFVVSPDPADLHPDTGYNLQDLKVTIRLNRGVQSPSVLRFYTLDPDLDLSMPPEPEFPGQPEEDWVSPGDYDHLGAKVEAEPDWVPASDDWVLQEVTLDGSEPDDDARFTKWTTTIAEGSYVFVNGPVDLLFASEDAVGNPVERFGAVTFRNGPVDGPAPTPATVSSGPFFPDPPDGDGGGDGDDGGPDHDVEVKSASHDGPLCVNQNNHKLNTTFTMGIMTTGLTKEDGDVTVTYVYLAPNGSPVPTSEGAVHVSPGASEHKWEFKITAPSDKRFEPGSNVEFTIKAKRTNGDNHTLSPNPIASVSSSC
jgi:type II secretory pathway pseudopilin PulG